jgi:outer membrane protein TolC
MRERYLQDFLENEQEALMRYRKEITRVDPVLTAHVTVLRQRLALTRLRRDQFNRRMNLLRLMGEPIGASVGFAGELEGFDLSLDDAVGIAFDNSIELALSREELAEQVRSVREVWWEFAPDVAGEVRWGDGDTEAALVLDEDGSETWALDAETDQIVSRSNDSTTGFQPDEEDWEASVTVTLPLFEGLRRAGTLHRERAELAERRVAYSSSEDSLELSVRQAYQSLEEARMSLEIERQALAASREILRIKEYQNSAEKITDDELETYRSQFFSAQDSFFSAQDSLIDAQENVRRVIGYYE